MVVSRRSTNDLVYSYLGCHMDPSVSDVVVCKYCSNDLVFFYKRCLMDPSGLMDPSASDVVVWKYCSHDLVFFYKRCLMDPSTGHCHLALLDVNNNKFFISGTPV